MSFGIIALLVLGMILLALVVVALIVFVGLRRKGDKGGPNAPPPE